MLRNEPTEVLARDITSSASKRDGSPLVAGERLGEGSAIRTAADGYVTLQLSDGSTLRLQPGSDLLLERSKRIVGSKTTDSRVELQRGKVEVAFIPADKKASRFEVRTPLSRGAVRGTEFRVSVTEKLSLAEVTEGAIAFSGARSGAATADPGTTVAVAEGFGSVIDESRVPIPPVRLLSTAFLPQPLIVQAAPTLRIRFAPVTGATRYLLRLGSDSEFRRVLRERIDTAPEIFLTDLEPGNYFVLVRAIDCYGLQGRDSAVPVAMIAGQGAPSTSPTRPPVPTAQNQQ